MSTDRKPSPAEDIPVSAYDDVNMPDYVNVLIDKTVAELPSEHRLYASIALRNAYKMDMRVIERHGFIRYHGSFAKHVSDVDTGKQTLMATALVTIAEARAAIEL